MKASDSELLLWRDVVSVLYIGIFKAVSSMPVIQSAFNTAGMLTVGHDPAASPLLSLVSSL